jgi:hypothetical protein
VEVFLYSGFLEVFSFSIYVGVGKLPHYHIINAGNIQAGKFKSGLNSSIVIDVKVCENCGKMVVETCFTILIKTCYDHQYKDIT